MWTLIENYLWVIPLLILPPYLAFPLVILATFRLNYPTTVLPLDLDESDLPSDITDFIIPVSRDLEAMGFEQVGSFGLPDLIPNVVSCSLLLVNRKSNEAVMVSSVCGTATGAGLKTKYVEFVSRFPDGSCAQTNNSRELGAFREPPNVHTIKFWDVSEVRTLHLLHTQIASSLRMGEPRLTLYEKFDGDLEAYINQSAIGDSCEYQTKIGLMRTVEGGYRATLKGAYIFVWQELFPFKSLRRMAAWRKSRHWLKEMSLKMPAHQSLGMR